MMRRAVFGVSAVVFLVTGVAYGLDIPVKPCTHYLHTAKMESVAHCVIYTPRE